MINRSAILGSKIQFDVMEHEDIFSDYSKIYVQIDGKTHLFLVYDDGRIEEGKLLHPEDL